MDSLWIFGGVLAAIFGWVLLLLACIYLLHRVRGLEALIQAMQEQIVELRGEEEKADAEYRAEMSRRAGLGAQAREENKEMRQAAMNEGREVLAANTPVHEKMGKLRGLIQKYPRVAEGVARSLNREFGISKQLGISEDALLQEVAKIMQEKKAPEPQEENSSGAW